MLDGTLWRRPAIGALICAFISYPSLPAESPTAVTGTSASAAAQTQTALARELLFGDPARRDGEKAVALLRTASAARFAPAEFVLGAALVSDPANNANVKEGSDLLARAGHDGCAGAEGLLGNILLAAIPKRPDLEPVALKFLRAGAEGGDGLSQGLLAALYRRGSPSLPRDLVSAYAWAHVASTGHSQQSDRMAKISADLEKRIRGELGADERTSADQRAAEYLTRYVRSTDPFCSQAEDVNKPVGTP